MDNDLIINIENGVIDFKQLLERVKNLEGKINLINEAVTEMDKEIGYLIDQDNKTSEILVNHAEVVKNLQEHIQTIKTAARPIQKKLKLSCRLVDDED